MLEAQVGLLERSGELEQLAALVERTRSGGGSVALLEGPAGIGKTSMLAAARELGEAGGLRVLTARAGLLERDLPWNIVRQLFASVIRASERERARLLAGAADLARLALGLPSDAPRTGDEAGALHGLYWLTSALTDDRPLLFAVDDAHWGDLPSLRYLAYIGERVADLPLLVLATVRTAERQDAPLQSLGVRAGRDRMTLRELTPAASAHLTREAIGEEAAAEFCTACHRATNGNPFLLRELLAELRREGVSPSRDNAIEIARITPESVKRSVLLRLSLLPATARELAVSVAVGGGELELGEAAALSGLDLGIAGAAADELERAGILSPWPPLRFVHPLVREVVYGDLSQHDRAERHRRAASRLVEAGADVHRVAVQLLQSPARGDGWVLERLRGAGRAALADGAGQAAAEFLRRALAEPPPDGERLSVLRELAHAEALSESAAAIDRLQDALALAAGEPAEAEVGLELLLMLVRHGQIARALELSHWLLARAPGDRAFELRVTATAITGAILVPALHPQIDGLLSRIPDDLPGNTPDERFALSARLAVSMAGMPRMDDVGELATRVLGRGKLLKELSSHELLYWYAASSLVAADRFELARDAIEAAVEDARRRGSIVGFALSSCFRCLLGYRTGDIAEATADGRQALDAAPPGELHIHAYAVGFLIDCLIERGELAEAMTLASAPEFSGELPDLFVFHLLRVARARTRIAAGDPRPAVQELLSVGAAMGLGRFAPALSPWRTHAVAGLLALGRREEARALAEEELALAEGTASAWAEVVARQALAATVPENAAQLLERAIEIATDRGFGLERARALVALGSHHRRHGRRGSAVELLEQGLEQSTTCGALALEERARTELAAAGLRPRRRQITGRDALTGGEQRVAQLAAQGMTNREIAQALFLSLRTVETHLTHSYQKLRIESRAQLASALEVADARAD